jgi:DNA-binding CsgD family transcriptional regulator
VQTYCKRIFLKTGTRRQAELVGLVLDSASILTH